jgi:putative membrane protein
VEPALRQVSYTARETPAERRRDPEMAIMHGMMGAWGPFALIGMFFNLVVFIGVLALLAWGASRLLPGGGRAEPAEEILRERFARGEITAEEYERALGVLRESRHQSGYGEYVREAMERLRSGRGAGS